MNSLYNFTYIIIVMLFLQRSSLGQSFVQDMNWLKHSFSLQNINANDLDRFLNPYKGQTSYLPSPQSAPWAGNYFPMKEGGLALNWQNSIYSINDILKIDLKQLSEKEISTLPAIVKYDLFVGDYTLSATRHELQFRGPQRLPPPEIWEGFCNGVRCAGISTKEPQHAVKVKNRNGLNIEFQPADIKALLGASYFYVEKYAQLGAPTLEGSAQSQPNAAIFDLALRYYLAKKKRHFIIDSHLGPEIWNETVVGYDRIIFAEYSRKDFLRLTRRNLNSNVDKVLHVDLTLYTLGEIDIYQSNQITKPQVASNSFSNEMNLEYYLYVDKYNEIIDGRWINTNNARGVDFAWFGSGKGMDEHYLASENNPYQNGNPYLKFKVLKKILALSTQSPVIFKCQNLFH